MVLNSQHEGKTTSESLQKAQDCRIGSPYIVRKSHSAEVAGRARQFVSPSGMNHPNNRLSLCRQTEEIHIRRHERFLWHLEQLLGNDWGAKTRLASHLGVSTSNVRNWVWEWRRMPAHFVLPIIDFQNEQFGVSIHMPRLPKIPVPNPALARLWNTDLDLQTTFDFDSAAIGRREIAVDIKALTKGTP